MKSFQAVVSNLLLKKLCRVIDWGFSVKHSLCKCIVDFAVNEFGDAEGGNKGGGWKSGEGVGGGREAATNILSTTKKAGLHE